MVRVKTFLLQLVNQFDISEKATKVATILFSKTPNLLNTFGDDIQTNQGIDNLIKGIPNKVKGGTRADLALMMADEKLFIPEAGDRPDAPDVVILMTDGKTRSPAEPFSDIVAPLKVGGC